MQFCFWRRGVQAHSLFVGSSCEDERVFGLGCGTCKREFVQACACTAINKKNIVLLCLLGNSFEDESVFGLRLWQVQKVVCSSLCLHIRKPKNLSWTEWGRFFGLWMCKYNLEPIPFCICQNLNPSTLAASKLLPTKQRRNRFVFFRLWMCKRKLEQIPFCMCQNPNPNTLSSSELLPTNKEATLQHLLRMWAKIGDQSCVSCAVH